MKHGIDISTWQKNVDYKKLKEQGVEFAIIRCGYGWSYEDKEFKTHYEGLTREGIKVGAYFFSYANNLENAKQEAETCLKIIKNKKFDLPIFYDLETNTIQNLGKNMITQMAVLFCETIEKAGYRAGVYANLNWWKNYLDRSKLQKYAIWLAQWNVKLTADFDVNIWQYSSSGKLQGIVGKVDLDVLVNADNLYANQITETNKTDTIKKEVTYKIVNDVILGKYGNGEDRKKALEKEGYNAEDIQEEVNRKMVKKKSKTTIVNEVIKGIWDNGENRKKLLESCGYNAEEIQKAVNKKLR